MQVEIIFTGLCAFLNLSRKNKTMGDPSVILVRANHGRSRHGSHKHGHVPFIAFNRKLVKVTGNKGFKRVPGAADFSYLTLDGVELTIAEDFGATLSIAPSYHQLVAKKDNYWPKAKNSWNRDFVPKRGRKPNKNAVAAYLRFGSGEIAAGKQLDQEWIFPVDDNPSKHHKRRFARDVVYRKVPSGDGIVTVVLTAMDTGELVRELRFARSKSSKAKVTLFIGNNTIDDMKNAVTRQQGDSPEEGKHFRFLNRIAHRMGDGPIPAPTQREATPLAVDQPVQDQDSGGSDGYCGPINGNG